MDGWSHKMAKHTQTIRREIADELFECVWRFYEIAIDAVTDFIQYINSWNQVGIIITNYDISLPQLLFCKNIVNLKECVATIVIL